LVAISAITDVGESSGQVAAGELVNESAIMAMG
jgi:hypothetical protein